MAWTKIDSAAAGPGYYHLEELVEEDGSKSLSIDDDVGAGLYEVIGIRIEYVAVASASTRKIGITVTNATDTRFAFRVAEEPITGETMTLQLYAGTGPADFVPINVGTNNTAEFFGQFPRLYLGAGDALVFATTGYVALDDMILHVQLLRVTT